MPTEFFGNINNKSYLARSPFLSRFSEFENTDENYVYIGFTPGLALQAAELNELQDNFYKTTSLSNIFTLNWTVYCILKGADKLENILNDQNFVWSGMIPLNPNMVSVNENTVTCSEGWYYTIEQSELRYWVYLSEPKTIDTSSSTNGYVNIILNASNIFAIGTEKDERLYDNSSGFPNTNSPGAYRVKVDIDSIQFTASDINNPLLQKINGTFYWPNGLEI